MNRPFAANQVQIARLYQAACACGWKGGVHGQAGDRGAGRVKANAEKRAHVAGHRVLQRALEEP